MDVHAMEDALLGGDEKEKAGKKATFVVEVHFRQNGTWQGAINWTEARKSQKFRSALEMLKLIDEALGADDDEAEWPK